MLDRHTLVAVLTPEQEAVNEVRRSIWRHSHGGTRELLERKLAEFPDCQDLRGIEVRSILWRKGWEEAEPVLERYLDECRSPSILAAASEIASFKGQRELARRLIEEAESIEPEHLAVLRQKATCHTMSGEHEDALAILGKLTGMEPDNPDSISGFAVGLLSAQRRDDYRKYLKDTPGWFKETYQYNKELARVFKLDHNLLGAEQVLSEAVAICPESAMCWAEYASTLKLLGKITEAERAAGFSLQCNASSMLAMTTMAHICREQGRRSEAEMWEAKAAKAVPSLKDFQHSRAANNFTREGKPAEAFRALKMQAESDSPGIRQNALRRMIPHLIESKDWRSLETTIAAIEGDEGFGCPVSRGRAALLHHLGRTGEAIDLLRSAPDAMPVRLNLLGLLIEAGRKDEADALVADLQNVEPKSPADAVMLVVQFEGRKYPEAARTVLAKSRRLFPEHKPLKTLDAAFQLEMGNGAALRTVAKNLSPEQRAAVAQDILRKPGFWLDLVKGIARALTKRKRNRKK